MNALYIYQCRALGIPGIDLEFSLPTNEVICEENNENSLERY